MPVYSNSDIGSIVAPKKPWRRMSMSFCKVLHASISENQENLGVEESIPTLAGLAKGRVHIESATSAAAGLELTIFQLPNNFIIRSTTSGGCETTSLASFSNSSPLIASTAQRRFFNSSSSAGSLSDRW